MNTSGSTPREISAVPSASGLASRLATKYVEREGVDPAPLLARSDLSPTALFGLARISVSSQVKFLEIVSREVGDEWIGMTLAADLELRELGMLYYVAASSTTLGDALKRLERYARLGNEALVVRLKKAPVCCLELSYSGIPRHIDRHQIEFLAAVFVKLCRKLACRNLTPRTVTFMHHRSGDLSRVRHQMGCQVTFDAEADEVQFDIAWLDVRLVGEDPFLNRLMMKSCEEALTIRPSNVSPFRTLVENAIAPLLPHADAQAGTVAKRIGMSKRTFARRLKSEGLTFSQILDELRRDLATRYLEDPALSVSKIAWLLGFHQPSAFTRACRRWTKKSPSENRRQQ